MSSSSLSKTLYRYGRDPVSMTLLVCVIVSGSNYIPVAGLFVGLHSFAGYSEH